METLKTLLHMHWGIEPVRLQALPSGHTNKTYLAHMGSRSAVLRVSWPGKSAVQVQREAAVLRHLDASSSLLALPRLQPTLGGQAFLQTSDGRWLHLFEHLHGSPGLPADTRSGIAVAMHTLAHLHAAMATIPASETRALAWLDERYARVAQRPAPALPASLPEQYERVLRCIGEHLASGADWIPGPGRWLHGDYHAGNLLFTDQAISGILDFDDVGQGSHVLEAAFALFALSRDTNIEDRFVFDARLWDTGLRAYVEVQPGTVLDWFEQNRDALMYLFCVDQVLIHLEAAQRELWVLGPGIGFLGCWSQLSTSVPRRPWRADLPGSIGQQHPHRLDG
jgi:Ser/Thr protein kinase RdoA (MazF antagonist)